MRTRTYVRKLAAKSMTERYRVRVCVVERVEQCVVIRLVSANKENRLSQGFIEDFHAALDQAESYEDATCVVTISEGKHFSLGLDLDLANMDKMTQYVADLQKLYCRLLTFPLVTIAAANGHIYAGGALFGLCHDYIIMNSERGFFCFPEIKLQLNFPVALLELAKATLQQKEHRALLVLGKRYSGVEAHAAGLVNEISPPDVLRAAAIAAGDRLAGSEGLDRKTLSALKRDLYRDVVQLLLEPPRFYSRM